MKILTDTINSFNPDLAYVHNTWFKASLGVFKILKSKNIKTIVKLHNFRYDCTKGYFIQCNKEKGQICRKCGREKFKFQILFIGFFGRTNTQLQRLKTICKRGLSVLYPISDIEIKDES